MTGYDNTNKGILSKNDRREKETHPEYTGTLNVEGVDYWVSGWVKERKDGSGKFFSLSVKRKEHRVGPTYDGNPAVPLAQTLNDEIPFAPEWR